MITYVVYSPDALLITQSAMSNTEGNHLNYTSHKLSLNV